MAKPNDDQPRLRLALLSTPRSGNTWTRAMLGSLYDLEQIPVHHPEEIDWENLPRRCVIQIHWYPIEPFLTQLREHEVRVVVLARHPLDTLMSWLNYVYYIHQEGYCEGGGKCLDCGIVGVSPRSEAFLEWTRQEYARCFLYHSPSWWIQPGAIQVRYEDLVAEPEPALGRLADAVGEPVRRSIAEVVEANSIGRKKPGQDTWHFHFWQGQPGLWRKLIPAAEARAIAASIPEPFEMLGYACDPDESLEAAQADLNWLRLQLDSTREHLGLERAKHRKTKKDLSRLQDEHDAAGRMLGEERRSHEETRRALAAVSSERDDLRGRLAPIEALRSSPRRVARRLKRIARRINALVRPEPGQDVTPAREAS